VQENQWEAVTLDKRKAGGTKASKTDQRSGNTAAEKKYGAGGNAKVTGGNMTTLDNDNEQETFRRATVGLSWGKALQKSRVLHGYKTQKDLANKIGLKVSDIKDYEAGNAHPNPAHVSKLRRILNKVPLPKVPKKPKVAK